MKVEENYLDSIVMVIVNAMKLSSEHKLHCSSHNKKCSEKLLLDNQTCSLPFDIKNNKPICRTYDEGLKAVRSRLAHIENCQKPCLQLDIDYKEEPKPILLPSVRPNYFQMFMEYSKDERSYIFEMPKNAKLISYKHEYTLSVALGYFGSMVGIFTGFSVISLLTLVMNYEKLKMDIKKWSLFLTQIGISIYLLIIFILLVNRFLEYPRDTSVNFAKTTSDFSMTICSSLQNYGVVVKYVNYTYINALKEIRTKALRIVHVSYDMILMTNEKFRLKWLDPRNTVDTLDVYTGSYKIDLLDENLPMEFSFLPIDNETIAACHTFQMPQIKEIDSLTLIYNEEVQVYFHNTGQLLYEWVKQRNLILPATEENVIKNSNSLNVYDTAVILKMERQLKLESDNYHSYDKCVICPVHKSFLEVDLFFQ